MTALCSGLSLPMPSTFFGHLISSSPART